MKKEFENLKGVNHKTKTTSFFNRHPVKGVLLFVVIFLLVAEILLRGFLFLRGYEVGNLAPYWHGFREVDSLEVEQQFFTDSFGIYKAKREFWEEQDIYINKENFRGREFDAAADSGNLKVLHIGDSFTWGYHAEPFDSCFADLMDASPVFSCYNAGIAGADPAQYLRVAEVYVPMLQPDAVIVNFYLANDLMDEHREIKPGIELYYQTNTGWLPAFYEDQYFATAQESYDFIRKKYTINGWFKKLFIKSAIGTAILSLPLRFEEYASWNEKKKGDIPNGYLNQIKKVCEKHNSMFLIFVIPNSYADLNSDFHNDSRKYVFENYPNLFKGLEEHTFILPMQEEHYYPMPDGHFNNAGHRVAAEFMGETLLKKFPADVTD